jgi:ribosomal protein S18 acetylase RimI-like enzyme
MCNNPRALAMNVPRADRLETLQWVFQDQRIDWDELSNLYRIAPLGEKKPADLQLVFSNSRFKCFVFDGARLVGAGRALADGLDCSYLCDVAVHPDFQGLGVGRAIITRLRELSAGHRKIILYANPGKEGFYRKLGFRNMRTAMAIFQNQEQAAKAGLVDETGA